MNIAFVTTCLGVGGAERVVVSLADCLANAGHTVKIFYLTGDSILKPTNPSIDLVGLEVNSISDLIRSTRTLASHLKAFDPDVVHSHLFHANILTRLIRPLIGIRRLITTAHNKQEQGKFRMLAYRLTDFLSDVTTNVCEEAVEAYLKGRAAKPGRILTVYNGIDTDAYRYSDEGKTKVREEFGMGPEQSLIVAVGRLHTEKDYPNLLKAISKLKVSPSKYLLLIAGASHLNEDKKLQILSSQLGIDDRVRFLGLRRDVPDLMAAADVFVLSSKMEGFPMVVGEAMSSECLVVGTDCGGVKEFLGDTGLLVPPMDPDELARMLDYALVMLPETREAFGRAARARIEKLYSLNTTANKWISIYKAESATVRI